MPSGLEGFYDLGVNATSNGVVRNHTQINAIEVVAITNSNPDNPTPLINSTFATNLSAQDLNIYFTPADPDAGETLTYDIWVFENRTTLFNINSII